MSRRKLSTNRRRAPDQLNKKALLWTAAVITILIILMTVLIVFNH